MSMSSGDPAASSDDEQAAFTSLFDGFAVETGPDLTARFAPTIPGLALVEDAAPEPALIHDLLPAHCAMNRVAGTARGTVANRAVEATCWIVDHTLTPRSRPRGSLVQFTIRVSCGWPVDRVFVQRLANPAWLPDGAGELPSTADRLNLDGCFVRAQDREVGYLGDALTEITRELSPDETLGIRPGEVVLSLWGEHRDPHWESHLARAIYFADLIDGRLAYRLQPTDGYGSS